MTNFTVRVTDAQSSTADSAQTVNTLIGLSGTLPNGTENEFYQYSLHVGGGVPPYMYAISAGALPPGLSIDPQSGVVCGEPGFGSPSIVGSPSSFTFTVQVQDSQSPPQIATSVQTIEISPATLAQIILALSPWGYWRLNETGTLTTATDSSGNARHGTYRGTVTPAAALYSGNAGSVEFAGTGCVNLPTDTRSASDAHTIVAFVTSTTTSGIRAIVGADDFGAGATLSARVVQFNRNNADLFATLISPSVDSTTVSSVFDASDTPMLIALVFDPTRSAADGVIRLYKDGAEVARSSSALTCDQTFLEWAIAAFSHDYVPALTPGAFDYGWVGRMSDVAIFTGRLEDADIAAIWAARNIG